MHHAQMATDYGKFRLNAHFECGEIQSFRPTLCCLSANNPTYVHSLTLQFAIKEANVLLIAVSI